VVGLPVSLRLVIPSLTGRRGQHPFAELAGRINAVSDAAALVPAPEAMCDRVINDKFTVQPAACLAGWHVLILETSGPPDPTHSQRLWQCAAPGLPRSA
jgi:hypothetical protein